jgi:hypothetical protein
MTSKAKLVPFIIGLAVGVYLVPRLPFKFPGS